SCGNPACSSPAKHPRTPHGVKDATTDPALITAWWTRWPEANVAVATGVGSGLLVIDVDSHDGRDGEATLRMLEQHYGSLPQTVQQLTGSGGRHLLFRYPGGPIANS